MGLGQYNRIGKYCGPHTASTVFLILCISVCLCVSSVALFMCLCLSVCVSE